MEWLTSFFGLEVPSLENTICSNKGYFLIRSQVDTSDWAKAKGTFGHRGLSFCWYTGLIIQCVLSIRAFTACSFNPPAPYSITFSLDSEPVT